MIIKSHNRTLTSISDFAKTTSGIKSGKQNLDLVFHRPLCRSRHSKACNVVRKCSPFLFRVLKPNKKKQVTQDLQNTLNQENVYINSCGIDLEIQFEFRNGTSHQSSRVTNLIHSKDSKSYSIE